LTARFPGRRREERKEKKHFFTGFRGVLGPRTAEMSRTSVE
jgi:hypothetical protein